MRAIRAIDRALTIIVTVLLICSFAVMLALAALQLLLRGTLHTSISWGDVAARQLVIWVGFFGAYFATRGEKTLPYRRSDASLSPAGAPVDQFRYRSFRRGRVFFSRARGATFVDAGLDPHATLFLGIPQTAAAMIVPRGIRPDHPAASFPHLESVRKGSRRGCPLRARRDDHRDRPGAFSCSWPLRRASVCDHRGHRSSCVQRHGNRHRRPHRRALPACGFPALIAIPLFTFAGFVLAESQAPRRLVNLAQAVFGWIPRGFAVVAVFITAVFTAFSGASGVTIIALGGLIFPALVKQGYPQRFSLGLMTTSGSLGLLFPPSLPIILYSIVAGVSIDKLFLAGLVPGILLVVILCAYSIRMGSPPGCRGSPSASRGWGRL